jgi:hypothetical protein
MSNGMSRRGGSWKGSASWLKKFRRSLIRWEKKAENYLGLVQLACWITAYRRTILG